MRSPRVMHPDQVIGKLIEFEDTLKQIQARFTSNSGGFWIHSEDDPRLRQCVHEIADFFNDIGFKGYSQQIAAAYAGGLSNFYESPSYASLGDLLAVIRAARTRFTDRPEVLQRIHESEGPPQSTHRPAPSQATMPMLFQAQIERLQRCIAELERFDPNKMIETHPPEIKQLSVSIETTLRRIFGNNTPDYAAFLPAAHLQWHSPISLVSRGRELHLSEYIAGVAKKREASLTLLHQAMLTLREDDVAAQNQPCCASQIGTSIELVLSALDSFTEIVRYLNTRRTVPALDPTSEAAVQDIVYMMLRPWITDLVPEDPNIKVANRYTVKDFSSQSSRLALETKYVRSAEHGKQLIRELNDDIESFRYHETCDDLVFFIFDPNRFIPDAGAVERHVRTGRTYDGKTFRCHVVIKS